MPITANIGPVSQVYRQFMCPTCISLIPPYVSYVSKNVGNNIKRNEDMKTKTNNQNTSTPLLFFLSCPNIFCNLNL